MIRLITLIVILLTFGMPVEVMTSDFSFDTHWGFPIAPQGIPPESFTALEASLDPDDCGTCHENQYNDWIGSRHASAMGHGIIGQLHSPWLDNYAQLSCVRCHAPLAEQSSFSPEAAGESVKENPSYIPELRSRGLTCAGCHVRNHKRYGPTPLNSGYNSSATHNSFIEVENFGDSRFCKPCHQFSPMDTRVNGKLLQNTYNEWKKSAYYDKGIHCTYCHMPGRRHLWRGIHSQEMVKKGTKISSVRNADVISITIANTGAGHYLPTYVTPKIVIRGSYLDQNGEELDKGVTEKFIGRYITLDLSEEKYDTRIPPGGEFKEVFQVGIFPRAEKFKILVTVLPDEFYTRFYKVILKNPPDGINLTMIMDALKESVKSNFSIYDKLFDL